MKSYAFAVLFIDGNPPYLLEAPEKKTYFGDLSQFGIMGKLSSEGWFIVHANENIIFQREI